MTEDRRSQHGKGIERRNVELTRVDLIDNGPDKELALDICPARGGVQYPVRDQLGVFRETVDPSAIRDLVQRAEAGTLDCFLHVGHRSDNVPLASLRGKTMTFRCAGDDLVARCLLDPRSSQSADAAISVGRGDLVNASIGFVVDAEGDHWNAQQTERTITRFADLPEFSLVTRGASPTTYAKMATASPGGRGRVTTTAEIRAELEAYRTGRRTVEPPVTLSALRLDLAILRKTRADRALFKSFERSVRAKYSDADRKVLAKAHKAMADGSFPVVDEDDLRRAIAMVGLAEPPSSQPAVRRHIMARAKALGLSAKIPKNWRADGTVSSK